MRGWLKTSSSLFVLLLLGAHPALATPPAPSSAAAAAAVSEEVPLDTLLSAITAHYRDAVALSARFTQVSRSPAFGAGPKQTGTILIARPRQLRVELQGADASQLISDGQTLWIYSPANRQVVVTPDLSEQSSGLSDLLGSLGALQERFAITRLAGEAGLHRLSLAPKDGDTAQFKALILDIDASTLELRRLEIVDAFDSVTEMRFSGVTLNPAVAADAFAFVPPEGVQVIRPDTL